MNTVRTLRNDTVLQSYALQYCKVEYRYYSTVTYSMYIQIYGFIVYAFTRIGIPELRFTVADVHCSD